MSLTPPRILAFACAVVGIFTSGLQSVFSSDVRDTFDRMTTADVGPGEIPNPIGDQYTIVSGTWCLKAKRGVTQLMATNPGIMYENSVKTDGAERFVLSADVLIGGSNRKELASPRNGGIIFHYVDEKNYCALLYRINEGVHDDVVEIRKVKDGQLSSLGVARDLDLSASTFYTMMIESFVDGEVGAYRVSLSVPGEKEPIYSDIFKDPSLPVGYSGFLRQGSASVLFSNYSLQTTN